MRVQARFVGPAMNKEGGRAMCVLTVRQGLMRDVLDFENLFTTEKV